MRVWPSQLAQWFSQQHAWWSGKRAQLPLTSQMQALWAISRPRQRLGLPPLVPWLHPGTHALPVLRGLSAGAIESGSLVAAATQSACFCYQLDRSPRPPNLQPWMRVLSLYRLADLLGR